MCCFIPHEFFGYFNLFYIRLNCLRKCREEIVIFQRYEYFRVGPEAIAHKAGIVFEIIMARQFSRRYYIASSPNLSGYRALAAPCYSLGTTDTILLPGDCIVYAFLWVLQMFSFSLRTTDGILLHKDYRWYPASWRLQKDYSKDIKSYPAVKLCLIFY